jgi:hypothetical protein
MSNFTTAKQVVAALEQALIKDAAAYIRELNTNSVVSRSHLTLRHLYLNFGKDKTDAEVSRQFESARQRRDAVHNQEWQCTECDWHGHEDDIRSELTFAGNREEPAEYDGFCPECGGNWDQMEEYDPGAEIDAAEYMLADR